MAKRRRQNYAPMVCIGAVVLVFSMAVLLRPLLGAKPKARPAAGENGVASGALPGIQAGGWDEFQPGLFYYRLSGRPYFENGSAPGSIMAENPKGNLYTMQLIYLLEDSGQKVYESQPLPPGSHIIRDSLLTPLDNGVHAATALILALDEAGEVVSEFEESIALFVGRQPD